MTDVPQTHSLELLRDLELLQLRAINAELLEALKAADYALDDEGYKKHGRTRLMVRRAIAKAEKVQS